MTDNLPNSREDSTPYKSNRALLLLLFSFLAIFILGLIGGFYLYTHPETTTTISLFAASLFTPVIKQSINVTQNQPVFNQSININTTSEINFTHLQIQTQAPYNSLIAYYPFDGDQASTKTFDFSTNNNDGTYTGGARLNTSLCLYQSCVSMDGVDDYISIPQAGVINNLFAKNISATAWIYLNMIPTVALSNFRVYDKTDINGRNGWNMFIDSNGNVRVRFVDGVGASCESQTANNLTAKNWTNVALSYDSSFNKVRLYINGNEAAYVNQTTCPALTVADNANNLGIGAAIAASARYFNGTVDEAMLFNMSLSPLQFYDIYSNQSARFFAYGSSTENGTINITSQGYNRVNFSINNIKNNYSSNISLSLGFLNVTGWFYTPYQNITQNNFNYTFNISNKATNLTWNYTLIGGSNTRSSSNADVTSLSFVAVSTSQSHFVQVDDNTGQANLTVTFSSFTLGNLDILLNGNDLGTIITTNTSPLTFSSIQSFLVKGIQNITYRPNLASTITISQSNITYNRYNSWYSPVLGGQTIFDFFNVSDGDLINPIVYLIAPQNNSNRANENVSFSANFTDETALLEARLFIYNRSSGLLYSNVNFSLISGLTNNTNITVTLPDGNYSWNYRANDTSQNIGWNNTNWTFLVDTIKPLVNIIYPVNLTNYTTVTAINFSITDLNLQACWYSFDNGTTNTTVACNTNITGLTISNGTINLQIAGNDSAGNLNQSNIQFKVDSQPPNIQFVSPTPSTGTVQIINNFPINVTATDAITYVQNITINLYNASGLYNSSYFVSSPAFVNQTGLADGVYTYNATAIDSLGNRNSTETRTITIDTQPAVLTILEPRENDIYSGLNTSLNVSSDKTMDKWIYNVTSSYGLEIADTFFTPNTTMSFTHTQNYTVNVRANKTSSGVFSYASRNFRFVYINLSAGSPGIPGTNGTSGSNGTAGTNGTSVASCVRFGFGYDNGKLPKLRRVYCGGERL